MIYENNVPRLVNLSMFKDKMMHAQEVMKNKKWNLNKILLIFFVIFTIFFLYNCRYGIFRPKEQPFVGV